MFFSNLSLDGKIKVCAALFLCALFIASIFVAQMASRHSEVMVDEDQYFEILQKQQAKQDPVIDNLKLFREQILNRAK